MRKANPHAVSCLTRQECIGFTLEGCYSNAYHFLKFSVFEEMFHLVIQLHSANICQVPRCARHCVSAVVSYAEKVSP